MGALSLVSLMGYRYSVSFLKANLPSHIQPTKSEQIKLLKELAEQGFTNVIQKCIYIYIYIYKYGHTTGISRQFIKTSVYLRVPLSHIEFCILTIVLGTSASLFPLSGITIRDTLHKEMFIKNRSRNFLVDTFKFLKIIMDQRTI